MHLGDDEEQVDKHSDQQQDWKHVEGPLGGVLASQHQGADDEEEQQAHDGSPDWGQEPAAAHTASNSHLVEDTVEKLQGRSGIKSIALLNTHRHAWSV